MHNFARFVPAIMPENFEHLNTFSKKVFSYYKKLHIDITDLSYGKETWFDETQIFKPLEGFEKIVIHLMLTDPVTFLINKNQILSRENCVYLIQAKKLNIDQLNNLNKLGFRVGVFFEINESAEIDLSLLSKIEEIMFLMVVAGGSGREANLQIFDVLRDFSLKNKLDVFEKIKLSVDGGLNTQNIQKYVESKANIIYANSFFNKFSMQDAVNIINKF